MFKENDAGTAGTPRMELPELNHEYWPGGEAEFDLYQKEVDSWMDQAKDTFMSERPEYFDQLESFFQIARDETLRRSRETGRKNQKYFDIRVQTALNEPLRDLNNNGTSQDTLMNIETQQIKDEAGGKPVIETGELSLSETRDSSKVSEEVEYTPSVVGDISGVEAGSIMNTTPSGPTGRNPNQGGEGGESFENTKAFTPTNAAQERAKKFQEFIKTRVANGATSSSAVVSPPVPPIQRPVFEEKQKVVDSFADIRKLVEDNRGIIDRDASESHQSSSFDVAQPEVDVSQESASKEAPSEIEAVLASADSPVSEIKNPENSDSVVEENESGISVPPEKAQSKKAPPYQKRVVDAINNGHGDTVPTELLLELQNVPEVKAFLEESQQVESIDSNATNPEDKEYVIDPNSVEGRLAENIKKGNVDIRSVSDDLLKALCAHPDKDIRDKAMEVRVYRESGHPLINEIPEEKKVISTPDEGVVLESPVDDIIVPTEFEKNTPLSESNEFSDSESEGNQLKEENTFEEPSEYETLWSVKSDDEKKEIIDISRSRFPLGSIVVSERDNGEMENFVILNIASDGKAFVKSEKPHQGGDVYKHVSLLELMELNPEKTEEEIQSTENTVEHPKNENESPLSQRENELKASREEFEQMTNDERKSFVGECQFLFPVGREFLIKKIDGSTVAWKLLSLNEDGNAFLQSPDGSIEELVPLHEFRKLNTQMGGEEILEDQKKNGEGENAPEQAELIANEFKSTYGINEKDLSLIEEFSSLSEGQQLLVRNELNNYAVSQIKTEALKAYREKYQSLQVPLSDLEKKLVERKGMFGGVARAVVGMAQFRHKDAWKKVGMSIFKRKILVENEKEFAEKIESGEIDQSEYIRELSLQAKEGPDAVIEDGKVRLQFLKTEDFGTELSITDQEKISAFNAIAGQFADIPHKWKERGATKEERGQYEGKELAYRVALDQVLEILKEKGNDESALIDTNELDRKITFTQFFNTHPESAEQLSNIKDQSVWRSAIMDLAKTRGMTMALGGSIRTTATAVASQLLTAGSLFVAAPLAGAATGAYMGRKRAVTELDEREMLAHSGIKDNSGEALNIVPAVVREVDAEGRERTRGLAGKLEDLVAEIERTPEDEMITIPLARQAPGEDGERGALLAQGEVGSTVGATGELVPSNRAIEKNKTAELLAQLSRRISYTQEKLDDGLVDFGEGKTQIHNRYALLRALSKAKTLMAMGAEEIDTTTREVETGEVYDKSWRKDNRSAEERLADILKLHEQNISEAQKMYIKKTTYQAAKYGAVFAFGGAIVSDVVHGMVTPGSSVIENSFGGSPSGSRTAELGASVVATSPSSSEVAPSAPTTPLPAGEIAVPSAPVSEGAIAKALHEGWDGPMVRKALGDQSFNHDYVKGMGQLTGRAPEVGISDSELNALLATDEGTVKNSAHLALIEAMRNSPTRLSDETVARIMTEHHVPTALEHAPIEANPPKVETLPKTSIPSPLSPKTASPNEILTTAYKVESGDNVTNIMREQIPQIRNLSAFQKENVIQNFLNRLTEEERAKIGISNPDNILPGDSINLQALQEILATKQVQREDLIAHAQHMGSGSEIATHALEQNVPASGSSPTQAVTQEQITQLKQPVSPMPTEAVQHSAPHTGPDSGIDQEVPLDANGNPIGEGVHDTIPLPRISSVTEKDPSIFYVMPRPEAENIAQEYLIHDMTDPRTGRGLPIWMEMKNYSARDVMTIQQSQVEPSLWQKILAIRQYAQRQGLDQRHQIKPEGNESLENYFRRGHAERIIRDGKREVRIETPARTTPQPLRQIPQQPSMTPLQEQLSRPFNHSTPPRVERLARPMYDQDPQNIRGYQGPDAESARIMEEERASGLYQQRQGYAPRQIPPPQSPQGSQYNLNQQGGRVLPPESGNSQGGFGVQGTVPAYQPRVLPPA